jgi:hypothetical protein
MQGAEDTGLKVDRAYVAHETWADPDAASEDGTGLGSVETSDSEVTEVDVSGITHPDYPRNVVINPSDLGTVADIAACNITITGTDIDDQVITEDIAVVADQAHDTLSSGVKAFKTITGISIPTQDGADAEFLFGYGDVLGFKHKLAMNIVLCAFLDKSLEGTAPTVTVSTTVLSENTVDLNSALDTNQVDVFYVV